MKNIKTILYLICFGIVACGQFPVQAGDSLETPPLLEKMGNWVYGCTTGIITGVFAGWSTALLKPVLEKKISHMSATGYELVALGKLTGLNRASVLSQPTVFCANKLAQQINPHHNSTISSLFSYISAHLIETQSTPLVLQTIKNIGSIACSYVFSSPQTTQASA